MAEVPGSSEISSSLQVLRLRSAMREFFPSHAGRFEDLTAPDTLELLAAAADPAMAARLSRSRIDSALRRARRRDVAEP